MPPPRLSRLAVTAFVLVGVQVVCAPIALAAAGVAVLLGFVACVRIDEIRHLMDAVAG